MKQHGVIDETHNRWCGGCGHYHGPLYVCKHYSPELAGEVTTASDRWRANLRDPKWCVQQINNGASPEAIAIFKALSGL